MSAEAAWWITLFALVGVLVLIQIVRPREAITRLAEWWIARERGTAEPACGYLPVACGTLDDRQEFVLEERVPPVEAPVVLRNSKLTNPRQVEMTARAMCAITHVAWKDEAGEWAALPCGITNLMAGDTVVFKPGMINLALVKDDPTTLATA